MLRILQTTINDSFKTAGFNLENTPLNRSQLLPALYKQLIDGMKQRATDNFTNNKRLLNCDYGQIKTHQSSRAFIANDIKCHLIQVKFCWIHVSLKKIYDLVTRSQYFFIYDAIKDLLLFQMSLIRHFPFLD